MTTSERWTQAVRDRVRLGRLLPLGGGHDGAWIFEKAAEAALRRAAGQLRGVRLDTLRIALSDPEHTDDPVVPAPPSALPPGPLRVTADFAATADEPFPVTAERLRAVLSAAATERLGLAVTEVDLRATALLDEEAAPRPVPASEPARGAESTDPDVRRVTAAALAVPGVTGLTATLAGHAVHFEEHRGTIALPRRHVRVEIAVSAERRALEVTRDVRARVGAALTDQPTVAVLVTAVG